MTAATFPDRSRLKLLAVRRLRDQIRSAIQRGAYASGVMPQEWELTAQFHTSRNVVRQVLHLLREEGLVERVQGAGTFVVAAKHRHHFDYVHGLEARQFARAGLLSNRIVSFEELPVPLAVAARLDIPLGSTCAVIEYVTGVDGEALSSGTSYVAADRGRAVAAGDFSADYYRMLEEAGIEIGLVELVTEAVLADVTDAGTLGVHVGSPMLQFERLIHDQNDRPAEYGFVRWRGDRLALVSNLHRHGDVLARS
jgi:GntR family transcriptional regulator